MPQEPVAKRAVTIIDGQNLFHSVREAFGYSYPNYDVHSLSAAICCAHGWDLVGTRFYTGIPSQIDNPFWHHFWSAKLLAMTRQGVHTYSRTLRYHYQTVQLPNGTRHTFLVGEEKGIDIRIALDVVRMARRKEYDVAVLFSQDQDLTEVSEEIRHIAREQGRWIKIASAFPVSQTSRSKRGVEKTDWIHIDRATYDTCLDTRDYRPKRSE